MQVWKFVDTDVGDVDTGVGVVDTGVGIMDAGVGIIDTGVEVVDTGVGVVVYQVLHNQFVCNFVNCCSFKSLLTNKSLPYFLPLEKNYTYTPLRHTE